MVAPIISGCFDCVMSDDRSDIMRGRACLDGRCHKTVPLAVPNNVGDRRVINNLGNLQTVVRPPTTKHLGTDVAAPRWRSSGRHPRNDRVFAGGAGESVSVAQCIESVTPATHPSGHRIA